LREVLNLHSNSTFIVGEFDKKTAPEIRFANKAATFLALDTLKEPVPQDFKKWEILERKIFEKRITTSDDNRESSPWNCYVDEEAPKKLYSLREISQIINQEEVSKISRRDSTAHLSACNSS